jgi:hypothetical protein
MIYIQRRGDGYLETVDEFETIKEARAMLAEYQMADPGGHHYLSRRPCKAWVDAGKPQPTEAVKTYTVFKRSCADWKSFASARKITVATGVTETEALRMCEQFNAKRTPAQLRKGTKLEYTS